MDDVTQLRALLAAHQWVPFTALLIGLVVRLLKSDTKIPIDIPPRARYWLGLGLGLVAACLEKATTGKSWVDAILDGLLSFGIAMAAHEGFISSIRGGKELDIPGLIKPGLRPSPTAPITIPPKATEPAKTEEAGTDDGGTKKDIS